MLIQYNSDQNDRGTHGALATDVSVLDRPNAEAAYIYLLAME